MTQARRAGPEPTALPPDVSRGGFRGRPFGLYAIVVVRVADALAIAAIATSLRPMPTGGIIDRLVSVADPVAVQAFLMGWVAVSIVSAFGLLAVLRWAWVATMVLVGTGLVGELLQRLSGSGDDLHLLLLVVSAFYLNQRAVRLLFERRAR